VTPGGAWAVLSWASTEHLGAALAARTPDYDEAAPAGELTRGADAK
jgi:hypothetical protein